MKGTHARAKKQPFHVGVDHAIPVVVQTFVKGALADSQSRVVDEALQGRAALAWRDARTRHQFLHAF